MKTILFLALVLSGCAATYRDFKLSDIKENEAVAVGRVKILYNGKPLNADCSVCLASKNGPCQKLTPEGFVFQSLARGDSGLKRIACKDSSLQHYNIDGANFRAQEGVNYFGDVTIEWKNKGGFKASSLFGAVGALADEASNDGVIRMTVNGGNKEMKEILQAFANQVKDNSLVATRAILKEGK